MKTIILIFCSILSIGLVFGQNSGISVYQKYGLNLSNVAYNKDTAHNKLKPAFGWDNEIDVVYNPTTHLSFGIGIGYSVKKTKSENYTITNFTGIKIGSTDLITETNAIDFPVFVKYTITSKFIQPYVKLGLWNSYLLQTHSYCKNIETESSIYNDDIYLYSTFLETTISDADYEKFKINRYLYGISASAGIQRQTGNRIFYGCELYFVRSMKNMYSGNQQKAYQYAYSIAFVLGINL